MSQEGEGAINQLYLSTLHKYERLKDEYDNLRKRYSEFSVQNSKNISKLQLSQVLLFAESLARFK